MTESKSPSTTPPQPAPQAASWQVVVATVVVMLIGIVSARLGLSPETTKQIQDGAAPLVSSVTGAPKGE